MLLRAHLLRLGEEDIEILVGRAVVDTHHSDPDTT